MIKSLTSLRGIFILFIFFHHCLNIYPGGGSMAVAFFFVLGGFSMTLGYKDRVMKPEFSYKQYITRRCIKFYPLHWICLLAVLPLSLLPFSLQKGVALLGNATLVHTLIPGKMYFSYNAVSWYLADTMFFAVLFPFLLRWIIKASLKKRLCIAISVLVLYGLVVLLLPQKWYHSILYISPYVRLTDFIFGIFLALGCLEIKEQRMTQKVIKTLGHHIPQLLILALIVLLVCESCLLPLSIQPIAVLYWPLLVLLIMVAFLTSNGGGDFLETRFLLQLGELSFVIFLTHQIVLRYSTLLFSNR